VTVLCQAIIRGLEIKKRVGSGPIFKEHIKLLITMIFKSKGIQDSSNLNKYFRKITERKLSANLIKYAVHVISKIS
jgi:hypothetical protein